MIKQHHIKPIHCDSARKVYSILESRVKDIGMRCLERCNSPFNLSEIITDEETRQLARYSGILIKIFNRINGMKKNGQIDPCLETLAKGSIRLNEQIMNIFSIYGAYGQENLVTEFYQSPSVNRP